jgi:hypothetical protein
MAKITEDQLWRDAYNIAWIGASNPRGVRHSITQIFEAGFDDDHAAVRAIKGHLDFLEGRSLGPEFSDLDLVIANARRLGIA